MQTLMIPQSPIADNRGQVTQEWLVFINELIRLSNNVISSGTIEKGDDAGILSIGVSSIRPYLDNDLLSSYVAPVITQDEQITNVALALVQDEPINNVALNMSYDEQPKDNPYALISAIEQQLYDQQIWGLNV